MSIVKPISYESRIISGFLESINSVARSYRSFLNEYTWYLYLSLKVVSQRPKKTNLKKIPHSINKRLSEISSDRECFNNTKTVYQEALNKSGFNYNLSYNGKQQSRKNRPRNILWYNPPFSKNVKTNVGKCFLSLIDQHFPKSNPLHKTFNRNTLKLSYSCMSNIKTIISNHNKAQINKSVPTNDSNCNCRKPSTCAMDGKCNDQNLIYQAEVTTSTSRETYIGLCDTTFKLRYRNHVWSFKNERYKHATELTSMFGA